MRAPSLLLLAAAAAARAPGVAPLRDVDPALDCGLRAIAYNFSLARLPDGGSAALVHDALRLAVDCGQAFAPVLGAAAPPRPRLPPRAADAPTFYVSPSGDDAAAGTEAAPFATLGRALRASRAGAVAARLVLRAGTHALAAPLVLTAADSGLSIAAYPGEAPVVSGGEALPADLEWTRFAPLPAGGVSGPFPELSIVSDAPGLTPGGNTTGIVYAGDFSTGEACRAACAAAAACTGYTWHDESVPDGWAQQGFFRTDNQYNPTQQTPGHFCGQKTQGQNATIWRAQLPAGTAAFDNLFDAARGRRLTRARSPNGNPEERIDGFTGGATAWLPPLPYAAPEEVHITSPSRDDDPFFPAYQLGVGGTCAIFEPASGFWCSKSPPAGSQFNVPAGMQIPAGLLGGGWADPTGAILHAFHGLRWGDWKFLVDGGNATHLSWTYGGFQEARGDAYGSTFMLENLLALLDEHDEFFFDAAAGALYVAVNDTAGGAFANPPLIATRLDSLIRVAGTPDEPVAGIVLDGLTFSHTAPTFMKPFAMASGGDLSVRVDGAVFLEGSVGAVVENCTFSGVGGNALFLYGFNRNASVTNSRFRFVGDSAVMSLGKVQGIDGTAREVPWGTVVAGNIMSEIGIYTKQSGAYYHALSGQASVVDNVMFNMPRAAININDGYAGGHRIEGNLAFNCVRETSDHGCFNSWDRQPYLWDPADLSNLYPQETTITGNLFLNNFHSVWPIDHDDGSNNYYDANNLLIWGGAKNYLGFGKTYRGNMYVFPEANEPTAPAPALKNGNPYCYGGAGGAALPARLRDVWANETCFTAAAGGASLYSIDCDASHVDDGQAPLLANNSLYTADAGYVVKCGDETWDLAAAQAHGLDVGTVVGVTPDTPAVLAAVAAFARDVLGGARRAWGA